MQEAINQPAASNRPTLKLTELAKTWLAAWPAHPDAAVFATCERFMELEREIIAMHAEQATAMDGMPEDASEAQISLVMDKQTPFISALHDLRATTLEGVIAKAGAFALWDGGEMQRLAGEGCNDGLMTWGIFRDLLALKVEQDAARKQATPAGGLDADLIALCERHRCDRDAVNADAGDMDDDDPVWLAYVRTRDAISDARPQTMVGVLAKARAAKASARMPDGSESVDGMAHEWAWEVVGDLERLAEGDPAPAGACCPLQTPRNPLDTPDTGLLALIASLSAMEAEADRLFDESEGREGEDAAIDFDSPSYKRAEEIINKRWRPLKEHLAMIPALTTAGIVAKARVGFQELQREVNADGTPESDRAMAWGALRDLLTLHGEAV